MLGLETVDEDELYAAMDWLLERQGTIEKRLAKRHLSDGALVLYDLTSTYFEGRCCALAKRGYSRDGKRDKLQIVFGLLCNRDRVPGRGREHRRPQHRRPAHREAAPALRPLACGARRRRHRGIRECTAGLDWISALRAPAIRELMSSGAVQRSIDDTDLAEIRCYPRAPDRVPQ